MVAISAPSSPMPSAVVIDASVWVSAVLAHDSNHAAALAWVNQHLLKGGSFIAPILLVTETASAVARITQRPRRGHEAASRIYAMVQMNLAQIDQALVDEATELAADLTLAGADAFYVAVARMSGLPLVTFDKEQLSRTTSVITTIRP